MTSHKVAQELRHARQRASLAVALTPGRSPIIDHLARQQAPWSSDENRALIGRIESAPPSVAARRLGRSTIAVQRQLVKLGTSPSRIRLAAEGLRVRDVASTLGVATRTAEKWVEQACLPVMHVLVGHRRFRVVDPDALLDWLYARGALYHVSPPDLAWREIVQEARAFLDLHLISTSGLCNLLAIARTTLHQRQVLRAFPPPVLSLYRLGAYFARARVADWLDQYNAWTPDARLSLVSEQARECPCAAILAASPHSPVSLDMQA